MYTKASEAVRLPRYTKNVRPTNSLATNQHKTRWRNCKNIQPYACRFDEYPHNRLFRSETMDEIYAVILTHSQRRSGNMTGLGLASPDKERDGDYAVKVLPGEVS